MLNGWDDLVNEFRALGGTLENARLGDGRLGRGLFPIEPERPFHIRIPPGLLLNVSDFVFENGALRVRPEASVGERERRFLEEYYAHVSWGGGGQAEIERVFEEAAKLPDDLRQKLLKHYRCGDWFNEPSPALIQSQFIDSRELDGFHDRSVMMPIIELANHGPVCTYDASDGDSLSLKGTAPGEITVQYSSVDSYLFFHSWGFVTDCDVAFSVLLEGSIGGTPLHVDGRALGTKVGVRPLPPTLRKRADGSLHLNYLMLGNRRMPRLCRGNFRSVFRSAGYADVDETFDKIRMANQRQFLDLLRDLELLEGEMARQLRRMARLQLDALTCCYGAREL